MIAKLEREISYFTNHEAKVIESDLIDKQFNIIATYINDILKPSLDFVVNVNIAKKDCANYFLFNNDKAEVELRKIDDSTLDDDVFDLLTRITPPQIINAIFTCNVAGLHEITAQQQHEVLLVKDDTAICFANITSDYIEENSISGKELGILGTQHFKNGLFITDVKESSIDTQHIKDGEIYASNIKDGEITSDKLGIFTNLPPFEQIQSDHTLSTTLLADKAIPNHKIYDGSINFRNNAAWFSDTSQSIYTTTPRGRATEYDGILSTSHIADNSITDANLIPLTTTPMTDSDLRKFGTGYFLWGRDPRDNYWQAHYWNDTFQFESRHIVRNKLLKRHFDQAVQRAMERLGAT